MRIGKIDSKRTEKKPRKTITISVFSRPNMTRIFNPDINRAELEEWIAQIIGKFSAKNFIANFEKLEIIIRYGYNVPKFGELTYMSDWMLQNIWDEMISAFNENDTIKFRFAYEDCEKEIVGYIQKIEEILKKDYGCKDDERPVFIWKICKRDTQWQELRDKIKADIDRGSLAFLEPQLSEFYRLKKIYEHNKNDNTFKIMRMQFDEVDAVLQGYFRKEFVTLDELHKIRNKLLK